MERRKKATIHDIAERAGVSISTVSRVLTGNAFVAEDKRQAVLKAAEELNYRPNVFAQALASGQSYIIGVLTQNLGNPFFESIMSGILQGMEGSEYSLIFSDGLYQPEVEKKALQTLLGRQVDGLIVLGGRVPEEYLYDIAEHLPLIMVGRNLAELREQCLSMDQVEGGYKATKYLIDMGHRHIAHITGITYHHDAVDRLKGYKQALADAGIEIDPALIVEGSFQERSGVLAVEALLARGKPFSAIFASNDQMAYGASLALWRRGIRVPEDVSIIGYDDHPSAAYVVPPLTTIQQPAQEMGQAAARAILRALQGEPFELPEIPVKLIVRESVARV
ncbi:MAG: substrate-binding domain-containing protein [Anaerolineae bacterium]